MNPDVVTFVLLFAFSASATSYYTADEHLEARSLRWAFYLNLYIGQFRAD